MLIQEQPKLRFFGVDFPRIEFNASKSYEKSDSEKINIDLVPRVFYPQDDSRKFRIIMEISLKVEKCFNLSIVAIGSFDLNVDIIESLKKSFINTNAPAIMFPYVRAFIATLTSNLGDNIVGTLNIPPQFFQGELEEIIDDSENEDI